MSKHLVVGLIMLTFGVVVLFTDFAAEWPSGFRIGLGIIFLVLAAVRFWRYYGSRTSPVPPSGAGE